MATVRRGYSILPLSLWEAGSKLQTREPRELVTPSETWQESLQTHLQPHLPKLIGPLIYERGLLGMRRVVSPVRGRA